MLDAAPVLDASQVDAGEPPPLPETTAQFDCEDLASGKLPNGIEGFKTKFKYAGNLAAGTGALYGFTQSTGKIWKFAEPSGPATNLFLVVGAGIAGIQPIVVDGNDLFYGSIESGVTIVKYALDSDTSLNLAIQPSLANVRSIVVDDDAVYWFADNGTSPTVSSLMRSDRIPGSTTMLASVKGSVASLSLQLIGDNFYFAASTGTTRAGETQLYTVPKTGGTAVPLGAAAGINSLATDGTTLFAALQTVSDDLGNPTGDHGVARVSLDDGSLTLLFETPNVHYGVLRVDDEHLYWATGNGLSGSDTRVWRGLKDGSGTVFNLAHGWEPEVFDLVVTDAAVYWLTECSDASYLVRRKK